MRAVAPLLAVLLLGPVLPGLLPGAEVDAEGFAPVLFSSVAFRELDLVSQRGLRLHAEVFLPADPLASDPPARFPAILVLSPYWGSGTGGGPIGFGPYDFLVDRLVPRGYAVVLGDLVGSGGSSGCWDYMGPVEREGSVAMVEAIAAQPWSDGKVGMMGLSYDAMTQVMAASAGARGLVTVVPAAPLTHAYGGVLHQGVRYDGGWRTIGLRYEHASLEPPVDDRARMPGWQERLLTAPRCMADNHAAELELDAYSAYFRARDHRPLGADVAASVFYIQGFRDGAVKPDNFGAWFDAVPTLKKAWLGDWGHVYPNARGGGRDDLYLTLHRWFDHTLKGVPNGIDAEPRFDVQDSQGRWRHEDAWPPRDATTLALRLSADGALVAGPPAQGAVVVGGASALPGAIPSAPEHGATFASAPFADGLHVAGVPTLRLTLSSDRPLGQVVARLYDGDGRRVSQGALDLAYRHGFEAAEPLPVGEPVEVAFALYPTDHLVAPGHALRLVLTTHDPFSWFEDDLAAATLTLHEGELALPSVDRGEEDVFLVSCGFRSYPRVPPCWRDLTDLGTGN